MKGNSGAASELIGATRVRLNQSGNLSLGWGGIPVVATGIPPAFFSAWSANRVQASAKARMAAR